MTKPKPKKKTQPTPGVRELDYDQAQKEMSQLISERRSVILASADSRGSPEASYAPFVTDPMGNFYVYVSNLARHTSHLRREETISLMLIEDEATAASMFGRRRLTLNCKTSSIPRESEHFLGIMDAFKLRFGDIATRLAQMEDFNLFQLSPKGGRLVLGFGAAFRVVGLEVERHLRGQHKEKIK